MFPTNWPRRHKRAAWPVKAYVEELLARKVTVPPAGGGQSRTPGTDSCLLDSLAQFSDKIPPLPETISRDWDLSDHD